MTRTRMPVHALLAFTLALASAGASAQSVTTFAGSGAAAFLNGPRLEAAFVRPQGVAVDSAGVVYVADTDNLRIRRITPDDTVTTFAGSGGQGYDGRAELPAVQASFWGPLGVAVDFAGSLWIADSDDWIGDGQWLKKVTPDGILHNLDGSVGYTPVAVATRGADVYVLDRFVGLWMFPSGGPAKTLAGMKDATGLAVDAVGNAYIADPKGHRILLVTAEGVITTFAGSGLRGRWDGRAENALFDSPSGVAVDRAGRVYVADTGNHRIRSIFNGFVSTVAGSGSSGREDGLGQAASFSSPRGLAFGPGGDLYVADTGNNLIRRIALPPVGCAAACTDWTVPSVARAPGPNGSFWTSDVTVHNRGSAPAALTFKFLGHDADGTDGPEKDVTIGPYQTVTFADVLASVFGLGEGWGAVRVRDESGLITVRSRTSTLRAGGTVGDGVPGVRTDRFFTDETAPTPVLTGLREDDRFRSNLVLVNGSAVPVDVLVTAFDSEGGALGSRTYSLRAYEATQDSRFLTRGEFEASTKTDVTVRISTATPGGVFTAYAALIDNGSNAPTTVLPQ